MFTELIVDAGVILLVDDMFTFGAVRPCAYVSDHFLRGIVVDNAVHTREEMGRQFAKRTRAPMGGLRDMASRFDGWGLQRRFRVQASEFDKSMLMLMTAADMTVADACVRCPLVRDEGGDTKLSKHQKKKLRDLAKKKQAEGDEAGEDEAGKRRSNVSEV